MSSALDGIRRGFAQRLLSTGKLAASATRIGARRLVGATGARDGELGAAIAEELDQMKGMAMKVGQILSYFDGVLPDEANRALQKLQRGTRFVDRSVMCSVIEEAFGAPVDVLFESFEDTPVAAASIGQVYRARFEGQPVAVKVQYPGIRDTVKADFSRLTGFSRLASMATAVDGPALVAELEARFLEECDYEREALHQTAFKEAFEGDAAVRIPAVIAARTRTTVITSEWCEGLDFQAWFESSDRATRDRTALLLARFAFRSLFEWGALNADPHPGNYLFPEDGAVVFLDFGCVRRFEPDFLRAHRALVEVVLDGDRASFRDALIATGVVADVRRFDFDQHYRLLRAEYAPYLEPRFAFTPELVRAGMDLARPSNPNLRRIAIPPQWIWIERLVWGLHALLGRLGAEGPFREVLREALATPLRARPEPMAAAPKSPSDAASRPGE